MIINDNGSVSSYQLALKSMRAYLYADEGSPAPEKSGGEKGERGLPETGGSIREVPTGFSTNKGKYYSKVKGQPAKYFQSPDGKQVSEEGEEGSPEQPQDIQEQLAQQAKESLKDAPKVESENGPVLEQTEGEDFEDDPELSDEVNTRMKQFAEQGAEKPETPQEIVESATDSQLPANEKPVDPLEEIIKKSKAKRGSKIMDRFDREYEEKKGRYEADKKKAEESGNDAVMMQWAFDSPSHKGKNSSMMRDVVRQQYELIEKPNSKHIENDTFAVRIGRKLKEAGLINNEDDLAMLYQTGAIDALKEKTKQNGGKFPFNSKEELLEQWYNGDYNKGYFPGEEEDLNAPQSPNEEEVPLEEEPVVDQEESPTEPISTPQDQPQNSEFTAEEEAQLAELGKKGWSTKGGLSDEDKKKYDELKAKKEASKGASQTPTPTPTPQKPTGGGASTKDADWESLRKGNAGKKIDEYAKTGNMSDPTTREWIAKDIANQAKLDGSNLTVDEIKGYLDKEFGGGGGGGSPKPQPTPQGPTGGGASTKDADWESLRKGNTGKKIDEYAKNGNMSDPATREWIAKDIANQAKLDGSNLTVDEIKGYLDKEFGGGGSPTPQPNPQPTPTPTPTPTPNPNGPTGGGGGPPPLPKDKGKGGPNKPDVTAPTWDQKTQQFRDSVRSRFNDISEQLANGTIDEKVGMALLDELGGLEKGFSKFEDTYNTYKQRLENDLAKTKDLYEKKSKQQSERLAHNEVGKRLDHERRMQYLQESNRLKKELKLLQISATLERTKMAQNAFKKISMILMGGAAAIKALGLGGRGRRRSL